MTPQSYPLWCAELKVDGISVGRVLGWTPTGAEDGDGNQMQPVVAFEADDDPWAGTEPVGPAVVRSISVPWSEVLFFGETRGNVRSAARMHALRTTHVSSGLPRPR